VVVMIMFLDIVTLSLSKCAFNQKSFRQPDAMGSLTSCFSRSCF